MNKIFGVPIVGFELVACVYNGCLGGKGTDVTPWSQMLNLICLITYPASTTDNMENSKQGSLAL